MNETSRSRRAARVLLVLSVALGAGRVTAEPPPYGYVATACENSYYLMPTTAARARAEVPARFGVLGEALGIGIVGVLFTTCEIELNRVDHGRRSWSDVGVLIDPPGGLAADEITIHAYRAWNVSDLPEMVALNAQWGIETAPADVDTAFAPGLPIATTSGSVDGPYGAYGGQGYWGGVEHAGAEGVVTWWSEGPEGVVRFDQAYVNDTEQCGVGAVTGEDRIGELLGGTGIAPHGCVVFANLIGTATLVEPTP